MIDFDVALDKLAAYQTSDELADYFRHEGVMGFPQMENDCPIARWMQSTTGEQVYVTDEQSFIIDDGTSIFTYKHNAEISPAMMEFVRKFDRGDYPELALNWDDEQWKPVELVT